MKRGCHPPDGPECQQIGEPGQSRGRLNPRHIVSNMANRSTLIAIVDADPSQGKALARLLAADGFTSSIFRSAEAYLCTALVPRPFCIIVDAALPGMTGLELVKRLR